MKKIISILLLSTLILSGCSDKDNKDDEIQSFDPSLFEVVGDAGEDGDYESSITSQDIQSTQYNYTWSLTDLSVEDITNECINLYTNLQNSDGCTIDQYYEVFGHDRAVETDSLSQWFTTSGRENLAEIDCITYIGVAGITQQMNDTITVENPFRIHISMFISDYDKAEQLYQAFYDYSQANYSDVTDDRDGTDWHASGYVVDQSNDYFSSSYSFEFLSMEKQSNGYSIRVVLSN